MKWEREDHHKTGERKKNEKWRLWCGVWALEEDYKMTVSYMNQELSMSEQRELCKEWNEGGLVWMYTM